MMIITPDDKASNSLADSKVPLEAPQAGHEDVCYHSPTS